MTKTGWKNSIMSLRPKCIRSSRKDITINKYHIEGYYSEMNIIEYYGIECINLAVSGSDPYSDPGWSKIIQSGSKID